LFLYKILFKVIFLYSRFDLYYSRRNTIQDKLSVREFFENWQRKLKQTNKNVSFEKNLKGLILKLGSRRSNNYSRMYEAKNFLKFEQKLSTHFLNSFCQLLPLSYSYMDWLVIKLRPIRKQPILQSFLNTDYIKSSQLRLVSDQKKFIIFFQFLVFRRGLDFQIEYLGSNAYRQVVFQVNDFLTFQNPTVKSTNYY